MGMRRILNNTAFMTASTLLTRLLAYLYFLIIARCFTSEQIGIYAILTTSCLIAELLANLGLDKIMIRDLARLPDHERPVLFTSALAIKAAAFVFVYLLLLGSFRLFYESLFKEYPFEFAVFFAATGPVAFARTVESYFVASERMSVPAVTQLVERVVIFLYAVEVMRGHIGFRTFLTATLLGACVRAATAGLLFRWRSHPLQWGGWTRTRRLFRESTEMLAIEVLAVIYFRVDTYMLSKLGDLRQTGIYSVTYKIFDCFIALFAGFLSAVFPFMSRNRGGKRIVRMLLIGYCGMSVVSLGVIILRHEILGLFGKDFLGGSTVLIYLMTAFPFVYVNSMLANLAVVESKVRDLAWTGFGFVITNICLNFVLIPRLGMEGAALTTLVCEMGLLVCFTILLKDSLKAPATVLERGVCEGAP